MHAGKPDLQSIIMELQRQWGANAVRLLAEGIIQREGPVTNLLAHHLEAFTHQVV